MITVDYIRDQGESAKTVLITPRNARTSNRSVPSSLHSPVDVALRCQGASGALIHCNVAVLQLRNIYSAGYLNIENMLRQDCSRIILVQKKQEDISTSDALITPDKKVQQHNGAGGSSSRRLFANGEPTHKDVNSYSEDFEEVQSRKRPCQGHHSCDAQSTNEQDACIREQRKRQATRRLFGSSPSPEEMDLFFKTAEHQVWRCQPISQDRVSFRSEELPYKVSQVQMLTSWTRILYLQPDFHQWGFQCEGRSIAASK